MTPISIYGQRFTGHVCDWGVLNDWQIQKIDLLTSTWGSICNIAKCSTHAVSTCKSVKLIAKVWHSVTTRFFS